MGDYGLLGEFMDFSGEVWTSVVDFGLLWLKGVHQEFRG